jgi:prevent-host-death family protein
MQVAMNELKANLSRCVARASAGEVIAITSHDKPVALLGPAPALAANPLAQMLASGQASWGGGKPVFGPPVRLAPHPQSMSDMVIEDRG